MSDERYAIEHRADESRYVLLDRERDNTVIGEEEYVDVAGDRVLFHTRVDEEYGGQGLASRLVRETVADAATEGRAIAPVCPYVKAWVEKHPDAPHAVVTPTPTHLRAVAERTR